MSKRFVCFLVFALSGCVAETEGGEPSPGEVSQAQQKQGGSRPECVIEQCNGLLNPTGTCTHVVLGECVECSAGGKQVHCEHGKCKEQCGVNTPTQ